MREVVVDRVNTPPFRLPDTISPRHYDIEVEPDLENGTFKGKVIIDVEVLKATQYIVFHAVRLKIKKAVVDIQDGVLLYPKVQYNTEQDAAYLNFGIKLAVGSQAAMYLEYTGEVTPNGTMGGLSSTPYQLPGGEVKLGFETMFEPILARSVFPCFDEPDLKAQFTVSFVVPSDLTCLSNMEVASENPVLSRTTPKKRVSFKASPKMSTYLVVMVAGYFNVLETNDFHVPIRVWAAVDKDINSATYALEIAVKAMKAHEKNFGLKYPLPKLDMVAIPGHQGGMEHWGCVTYDERGLILPVNPSESNRIRSAYLIAHELAHQWFGNIVTMKFWDSLWLNEAFSEWAAIHALSQILTDFNPWASFIGSSLETASFAGLQTALELDSTVGSHAIQAPNLPAAASFDSITYLKGCSIIRMMAENLGVDMFLQGVRLYLKRFEYGNATTEQLWDALSEVSGRDVAELMSAWTKTVGFPLLTVNELRPKGEIVVTQSRFLQNGDRDTKVGPYPVTIRLRGPGGVTTHQMTGPRIVISVNLFKYKLNADQVGFYRVAYPLSRIHKFGVQFFGNSLSIEDKVGIIADLGSEVLTGSSSRSASISDFLEFLLRIKEHFESLYVWREILGQLGKIRAAFLFESNEILDILKSVRYQLLTQFLGEGSLEFTSTDSTEQIFLKTLLFSQLQDYPLAQNTAKTSWKKLLGGDKNALNPNIKQSIFNIVLSLDTTDQTWETLKSIAFDGTYIHSGDPVTPIQAFQALGSSPDPLLIARSLQLITPDSNLSAKDAAAIQRFQPFVLNLAARVTLLKALAEHRTGAESNWVWLRANWDLLVKHRELGGIQSYAFVGVCLYGLATNAHILEIEEFFADKTDESPELVIKVSIDKIRARARFVEADRDELLRWAKGKNL